MLLDTSQLLIQGGPLFLPPPKKTESQTWGEFSDSVFFFTPCQGLCFLGGGKNSGPPCRYIRGAVLLDLEMLGGIRAPHKGNQWNLPSLDKNIKSHLFSLMTTGHFCSASSPYILARLTLSPVSLKRLQRVLRRWPRQPRFHWMTWVSLLARGRDISTSSTLDRQVEMGGKARRGLYLVR